ncbi:hypothetical protein E6O51_01915 [Pseudothauera rhizosphaerae]|uniref:Uncharacterized protein n=1 Tax=Pseudothauera rhizosphaerae TaxID=2565932 RepID=A0A4S4AZ25_9RHOO|nr:hypothetical protein E6O51_01915 [Pseudothauera rhizosphaerae]
MGEGWGEGASRRDAGSVLARRPPLPRPLSREGRGEKWFAGLAHGSSPRARTTSAQGRYL